MMTIVAVMLFALLIFFWITFNSSRVAFNKATQANLAAVAAHENAAIASERLIKALNDQVSAQSDLIVGITAAYSELAKTYVKQRLVLIELRTPGLKVSEEIFDQMDRLKVTLEEGAIDSYQYFAEVDALLNSFVKPEQ